MASSGRSILGQYIINVQFHFRRAAHTVREGNLLAGLAVVSNMDSRLRGSGKESTGVIE